MEDRNRREEVSLMNRYELVKGIYLREKAERLRQGKIMATARTKEELVSRLLEEE